ncbi:sulfate adenylyltransferase subunit CysN [Prescottella equi]|uniref:Multifunctional fusion protein n=2 Tax=Rhodococcus hoagii TaxID=43767 RepID=E9T213_RHOHA|nr:sulfate adenylyltransferase subunit CysN [Prescottella equi]MBU4617583.1 sulfate adenylyltransferase subunit CysN [Rhodococcus sp. GG48]GBF16768.1 bifunctional enzyme CysN/CysC [Rhodococcus sp. Br-6]EGD23759.1 adenylyl-sulfate kinase [Prescottella equi ATCC 33707]ERN47846.1 sulfate adenylyltransferase subunit 1/adenylyl-sulfate kinase cysnc [Prescottella equi NBRC 101255 = C 7]MBM4478246.1 sulfate adenylyltransferase subunit CysN [Prescottella equi]
MAHASNLIADDIEQYLERHANKSMLRFITCGSVDDGKSTLIGRLLYESKLVFEDQLSALENDSKKVGTQGEGLDFALLVDGLAAEREQGITIDVAYRYFTTERRKFVVADTPGHEQYTRNMVTGASTADLAVILVDARKGVLTQTRRHSYLVSLLGIRHVVLAVNKLDLVDYSQEVFERIAGEYADFAAEIGLENVVPIPMSAYVGDNLTEHSPNTQWYTGPTLIDHLETVEIEDAVQTAPFRMPVQWVNRPDLDFRGFSGQIVSGIVRPGDRVRALPSGRESTVARIVTMDGDLDEAVAGRSVTITLADEIDISRGDVLAGVDALPCVADQFEAQLVWMGEHEMLPERPYLCQIGTVTVQARITRPKYKVNVNTLEQTATNTLALNEIGVCNISFDRPVPFDPYADNRDTGGFILIDRLTNTTVGAGMIAHSLRRSDNIHWQAVDVNDEARSLLKGHRPQIVWFTGLSGSGKSTIANELERRLYTLGCHTYLLDGDNVRHGLGRDLGFTEADRVENIRRVTEVARLMADAGLIVLASFISPFRAERDAARELIGTDRFCEVFVDTPIEVAEERDPKGLYRKARRGELANFTGVDSPYETPTSPDVRIDTTELTPEHAADRIVEVLRERGVIS